MSDLSFEASLDWSTLDYKCRADKGNSDQIWLSVLRNGDYRHRPYKAKAAHNYPALSIK